MEVPTAPSPEELAGDWWDDENRLCYSADGTRLLDAENFPPEVSVREGCQVLCDDVFAFQDYMALRRIGEKIPLEERSSYLEKIHLPGSITHIGKGAFAECGELITLKLPKSLLLIADCAFLDCWQLERLTLPAGLRVIGAAAFQGCINLYRVKFGKAVEVIGPDAFDDCGSLEEILIPKGCLEQYKTLLPRRLHKYLIEQ